MAVGGVKVWGSGVLTVLDTYLMTVCGYGGMTQNLTTPDTHNPAASKLGESAGIGRGSMNVGMSQWGGAGDQYIEEDFLYSCTPVLLISSPA